ncbi:transcriptional repressor DicA [Streptococcus parauberis]|uniref:Transcriptional repressor DicA n=1 Tax=Streptococcus parauberis TaxID=1348 RepID=A0A854WA35_9STRE|nr:transcriptional repressor DicA [Streptococcus parauberis]
MATLPENIKYFRKQQGLTQKDLANKLNMAPTAISSWEVGRNKPLMDNIELMARIFNIKKSELLGDDLLKLEESDIETIDLKNTPAKKVAFDGRVFDESDMDFMNSMMESYLKNKYKD